MMILIFIFGVLGFIPLLIVLWRWRRIEKLKRTGVLVTGVVEDVIERRGYKGSRYYHAIVQYYVAGRGTMRSSFVFHYSRKRPLYTRKQSVEMYYNREKPEKIIPKDAKQSMVALVLTIIMAVAYVVLAYFIYDFITYGER